MPKHSKKHKNIFHLTNQQKEFIHQLLPKRYNLFSIDMVPENEPLSEKQANQFPEYYPAQFFGTNQLMPIQQSYPLQSQGNHPQASNIQQQNSLIRLLTHSDDQMPLPQPPIQSTINKGRKASRIAQNEHKQKQYNHYTKQLDKIHSPIIQQQSKIRKQKNMKESFSQNRHQQNRKFQTLNLPQKLSNEQKQFCLKFLGKLKVYKSSWPFRVKVDPQAQGVPNYLQIVKDPMDLKTIEKRLKNNEYQHVSQFHLDILRIIKNSYKFNPRQTNYFHLTTEFEDQYYRLLKTSQSNPQILDKMSKKVSKVDQADFIITEEDRKKKKQNRKNRNNKTSNYQNKSEKSESQNYGSFCYSYHSHHKKKFSREQRLEIVKKIHLLPHSNLQEALRVIASNQTEPMEDSGPNYTLDFEKMNQECLDKLDQYFKHLDGNLFFNHREYASYDM